MAGPRRLASHQIGGEGVGRAEAVCPVSPTKSIPLADEGR